MAAPKEKREPGSRSPHVVFYSDKYIRRYRKVKEILECQTPNKLSVSWGSEFRHNAGVGRESDSGRPRKDDPGNSVRGLRRRKGSAEEAEVEGDDDVLAVGGEDFDLGVVRSDVAGTVFEPDEPAREA
jgi:hypothetical protein